MPFLSPFSTITTLFISSSHLFSDLTAVENKTQLTLSFCLSFGKPCLFACFGPIIPQCSECWKPYLLAFFQFLPFDLQFLIDCDFRFVPQKKGKMSFQMNPFFCSLFLHFQKLKSEFHFTCSTTPTSLRPVHKLSHWFFVPIIVSISNRFLFSTQSHPVGFQISTRTSLFNQTFPLFLFNSRSTYLSMRVLSLSFHAVQVLSIQTHFYVCHFSISILPILFLLSALTSIAHWSSLTFSISPFESFNEADVLLTQNMPIVVNVHFICLQIISLFYQALLRTSSPPLEQLVEFLLILLVFIHGILWLLLQALLVKLCFLQLIPELLPSKNLNHMQLQSIFLWTHLFQW